MRFGEDPAKLRLKLAQGLVSRIEAPRFQPVTHEGGVAAILQPAPRHLVVIEEIEQDDFVIAHEMHGLEIGQGVAQQQIDDRAALLAAVDVIAQKYDDRLGGRPVLADLSNPVQQFRQKVRAAMNVADHEHHPAWRNFRARRLRTVFSPGCGLLRVHGPIDSRIPAPEHALTL